MHKNDNTISDQVNNQSQNNVVNITQCYTTPVVDAISAAHIYVDPAVWSDVIVNKKSKKTNWIGIFLLSKILYWYTRTEVYDEESGRFKGYKKKFKADKLQAGYTWIQEQLGCTYQEARDALDAVFNAGLVTKELRGVNGKGNVMFIEPVPAAILCIINPPGVHKKSVCAYRHRGSVPMDTEQESVPMDTESTLCSTSCSALISTYDSKGDQSVDNPEGLPTAESPTNKNFDKEKRERARLLINQAKEALTKNKNRGSKNENKNY